MQNTKKYYECDQDGAKWEGVDVPTVCPTCKAEGREIPAPMIEDFKYEVALEAKDPLDTVIERSGIKARFTMREVADAVAYNQKFKKELEGQLVIDKAKIANVEECHPVIKTLKPVELAAVLIYTSAIESIKKTEDKLKEVDDALEQHAALKVEVEKSTGIVAPIESPFVAKK